MTGTSCFWAPRWSDRHAPVWPKFFVGAILGGRLMWRRKPAERLFAESLCVTAALILAAARISAADGRSAPDGFLPSG